MSLGIFSGISGIILIQTIIINSKLNNKVSSIINTTIGIGIIISLYYKFFII